jgi:hypothetical protein
MGSLTDEREGWFTQRRITDVLSENKSATYSLTGTIHPDKMNTELNDRNRQPTTRRDKAVFIVERNGFLAAVGNAANQEFRCEPWR